MKKIILFLSVTVLICSCKEKSGTGIADKIYFNARIWTGDPSLPWAEAIAVKGNEIIFTEKDYQSVKGGSTELVNLEGRMVVPGLIDNHTHFLSGGYYLSGVKLRACKTPGELITTLKEFCNKYKDDRWILGGDWDHEAWGGELPTRKWIDSVSGDHPVFLSRYDGHMALSNTKALMLAGISKNTKIPPGGEMRRFPDGEYTGLLKDEAMGLVNRVIPNPSDKELEEYLQAAVQHAFENGVTQVHDMGSYGGWLDLQAYRNAYKNNSLDLRIYSFVPLSAWQKLDSFCKIEGRGDDMLRWGALKGYVDGSLGSTTAWFYNPYLDDPSTSGFYITDTTDIMKWVLDANKAGLHVTVHAIGDRANDFILNVFEKAGKNNAGDHRFRVEHAQHLSPAAIPRFARLKVIPSMQPYHAIDDGRWAYKRLDDARLKGTYAFKNLLDTHAALTFGSDWTVAPLTPLDGIYAAVTRRTLDDKNPNGWFPEQKISVEQALACYTINNAFAGFQETKLGMLKKGMLADFVVLDQNLFEIPAEKIRDVKVMRTIVNGKEVFTR